MRCFFGIHKFSKWRYVSKGDLKNNQNLVYGHWFLQERKCELCGLSQVKEIKTRHSS